jgi:hypothetical protein
MADSDEDRDRSWRSGLEDRDGQSQVEYSVIG